jgi:RNA polymerase sigma-70 factor (ECF subfamily)
MLLSLMAIPHDVQRDREWIEGIQAGDESAFAALFAAYYPALCEFVRISVQSDDLAEEAVDDVFFVVWEERGASIPTDRVAAYLFAAVRNRALKGIRGRTRRWRREERYARETVIQEGASVMAPEVTSDEETDRIPQIWRAVETLPDRCREIFLLRWTGHLSYAEIAQIVQVSIKTVENQLAIALKRLKEQLRP